MFLAVLDIWLVLMLSTYGTRGPVMTAKHPLDALLISNLCLTVSYSVDKSTKATPLVSQNPLQ